MVAIDFFQFFQKTVIVLWVVVILKLKHRKNIKIRIFYGTHCEK